VRERALRVETRPRRQLEREQVEAEVLVDGYALATYELTVRIGEERGRARALPLVLSRD
jgi:hypothetical protein